MRILVIEDEKNIRDFLVESLRDESFTVESAADGEEGSYLARTNDYDLILLDNMLPKRLGPEVAKEIRSAGVTTPIIMLTVKSEISEKVTMLNLGVDDYVVKPFSFEELLARIRAMLRRPRQVQQSIVHVGPLTLDSNSQSVRKNKKDIYLTRKEFALLEFLVQHRGNIVTKGMIMEHVWDLDTDPFTNSVEMHIMKLRKKIDQHSKQKLIRTIPGRGYIVQKEGEEH